MVTWQDLERKYEKNNSHIYAFVVTSISVITFILVFNYLKDKSSIELDSCMKYSIPSIISGTIFIMFTLINSTHK